VPDLPVLLDTVPMSSPETKIVFERSDRLLSGATLAVRGVALPQDLGESSEVRSAIAITLQVDATSCQVSEDGTVTATVLIAPGEAFGVSRWLREAAQSVAEVGPPLFDWESSDVAGRGEAVPTPPASTAAD
jgi:hypothetical protein